MIEFIELVDLPDPHTGDFIEHKLKRHDFLTAVFSLVIGTLTSFTQQSILLASVVVCRALSPVAVSTNRLALQHRRGKQGLVFLSRVCNTAAPFRFVFDGDDNIKRLGFIAVNISDFSGNDKVIGLLRMFDTQSRLHLYSILILPSLGSLRTLVIL